MSENRTIQSAALPLVENLSQEGHHTLVEQIGTILEKIDEGHVPFVAILSAFLIENVRNVVTEEANAHFDFLLSVIAQTLSKLPIHLI